MVCLCSLKLCLYVGTPVVFAAVIICILFRLLTKPYPVNFRTKKEESFLDCSTEARLEFPSLQDAFSRHLTVVVPAYEEQQRLPPMLDECLSYLEQKQNQNNNFKYEVIIVSDGSKDKTVEVALQYSKKYGCDKVRVLELEYNRGKGGAIYMGIQCARGSIILFADADGATKFEDLSKLETALELIVKSDYTKTPDTVAASDAIICGSRAHLEEDAIAHRSLLRNLLMHGFHFLVWFFTVRSIRDTQCGFKLLTRSSAKKCFRSLHVKRWAFDVELIYIAEALRIPIAEVAVRWTEIEGSKLIPIWSWLQMGRDLFLIWFRYKIGAWRLVTE